MTVLTEVSIKRWQFYSSFGKWLLCFSMSLAPLISSSGSMLILGVVSPTECPVLPLGSALFLEVSGHWSWFCILRSIKKIINYVVTFRTNMVLARVTHTHPSCSVGAGLHSTSLVIAPRVVVHYESSDIYLQN